MIDDFVKVIVEASSNTHSDVCFLQCIGSDHVHSGNAFH